MGKEESLPALARQGRGISPQGRTRQLKAGDVLPTARKLAETYGVASMTAQRALRELQQRGLTYAVVGKGTFVHPLASARLDPDVDGRPYTTWLIPDNPALNRRVAEFLLRQNQIASRFVEALLAKDGQAADAAAAELAAHKTPIPRPHRRHRQVRSRGRHPATSPSSAQPRIPQTAPPTQDQPVTDQHPDRVAPIGPRACELSGVVPVVPVALWALPTAAATERVSGVGARRRVVGVWSLHLPAPRGAVRSGWIADRPCVVRTRIFSSGDDHGFRALPSRTRSTPSADHADPIAGIVVTLVQLSGHPMGK